MSRPTNDKKLRRLARAKKGKRQPKRKYTVWEKDAMAYHNVVISAVKAGTITQDQAEAELLDASKAAGENLRSQKAPYQLVSVVEQLIIHGSYDGLVKALKAEEVSSGTENK